MPGDPAEGTGKIRDDTAEVVRDCLWTGEAGAIQFKISYFSILAQKLLFRLFKYS